MEDDVQVTSRRRPRWQLGAVAIVLIALVGVVVWERSGTTNRTQVASATAGPTAAAPVTIVAVSVAVNGTSFFVKDVKGLTITPKGPGTGLQFTRGLTTDTFFTDWVKELHDKGKTAARHDMVLTMLDAAFAPVKTYHVSGAVPVSVSVAPIDGTSVVEETLTVSYDGITTP